MKMAPPISLATRRQGSDLKGGCHDPVNDQSCSGIVVLLCVAILAATRYRREHKDEPVARWRDVHPIRDWLHHKH